MADAAGIPPYLPFRTERLLLRPVADADAAAVRLYASDPDVALKTASIPHPYPDGAADEFVAAAQNWLASGRALSCAVERADAPGLIGTAGLVIDGLRGEAELGFWIGKPFWGRGYATEAARGMLRLAFAHVGLQRVRARALASNAASIRVQAHAGMRLVRAYDAICRPSCPAVAQEERAITRAEWQAAEGAKPVLLVSAVALVDIDGRLLIARRPEGKAMAGLWEFPGGKVHDGETPEAALIRELHEELGIDTHASCLAPLTFASHAYDAFHLLMPVFACRKWQGTPRPREGQALKWVPPRELTAYPMPPADVPLIALLRDML
ncbi:MAG: bifunctional GNAT family N-acetyltransferase/(deoxy)nucleoside triphosphate pyrophosphohydrolase [Alphaproteobacteria bacterium]